MSLVTEEYIQQEDEKRFYPVLSLLPLAMRRRIKALKKLQFMTLKLQSIFHKEVHKLDCEFMDRCADLMARRFEIVNGLEEPTGGEWEGFKECGFEGFEPAEDEECTLETEHGESLTVSSTPEPSADGLPGFWLAALKNSPVTAGVIFPQDEAVLLHLVNITVTGSEEEPMSFKIIFHFMKNPFFRNLVLQKEYIIKCEVDERNPWTFDGPEIVKAIGCTIVWEDSVDLTKKTVFNLERAPKRSGQIQKVAKTVMNDSFFNFFNPPSLEEPLDLRQLRLLDQDFVVGRFIKEKLVPRAVLYFTGEAQDEESCGEESTSSSSLSSYEKNTSSSDEGKKTCEEPKRLCCKPPK